MNAELMLFLDCSFTCYSKETKILNTRFEVMSELGRYILHVVNGQMAMVGIKSFAKEIRKL